MPKPGQSVMSTWLSTQIQNWWAHNAAMPTPPDEVELSLHTDGGPALDGTNTDEVDGTDYTRVVLATEPSSDFNDPVVLEDESLDSWVRITNDGEIDFGTAGSGGWGEVDSLAIWFEDNTETERLLFVMALTTPREINEGDPVRITDESLVIEG